MKSDLSALEKCSPFLWGSQSYRKARQTKSFQGTLKGLEGTVVNTVVAQSVGVLLTWYLKSSKWPLEAAQWEAVLSILWKFPSPDAAGRSPMGWELVCLWSFKMSSCLWACLHLLASEFVALKNMEVHPKLSLPAQDEEGVSMVQADVTSCTLRRRGCVAPVPGSALRARISGQEHCWPPASSWQGTNLQTLSPSNRRWAEPDEIWPVQVIKHFAAAELIMNLTGLSGPGR